MNENDDNLVPTKAALILGLGETGEASAHWLARQGRRLVLVDTRHEPTGLAGLENALADSIEQTYMDPTLPKASLNGIDLLVLSPGLSPLSEPIKGYLEEAANQGIEIVGEIELFARALQDLATDRDYHPKVLGVTGTNGKTTVTALTRQMLVANGWTARAAGNIGPAALTALMQALDADDLPQAWVLELSSFQLHTTSSLALAAATILNVSQDHLDWHGDLAAYQEAKSRLFAQSSIAIANRDDPVVRTMVESMDGWQVRTFGQDAPVYTHDLGLVVDHDVQWICSAEPVDFEQAQPPVQRRRKQAPLLPRTQGRSTRLMPVEALPMAGLYNAMNVMAAALLVRCVDGGWAPILKAASQYLGEPHRMQFVRTTQGIPFYDDSKGTNVAATVAGVQGLGQPVVLIAGGQAKGQDFSDLARAMALHGRAAVLIGEDAPMIKAAFEAMAVTTVTVVTADSMDAAVAAAYELAQPGDAVVLSPACASFDMFADYKARGHAYVEAVRSMALSVGEVA